MPLILAGGGWPYSHVLWLLVKAVEQGALVLLHVAPLLQLIGYLGLLQMVVLGFQTQEECF